MRCSRATRSRGAGCRDIRAIPRTNVSTRSPAPRSNSSPARRTIAPGHEARNILVEGEPVVPAALEHRAQGLWEMRIRERADRDAVPPRVVCRLPEYCGAATGTEMKAQPAAIDLALIDLRGSRRAHLRRFVIGA